MAAPAISVHRSRIAKSDQVSSSGMAVPKTADARRECIMTYENAGARMELQSAFGFSRQRLFVWHGRDCEFRQFSGKRSSRGFQAARRPGDLRRRRGPPL